MCVVTAVGVLLAGGVALAKEIQGTAKNDRLKGTTRGDLIYGFGGDDTILGKDGNDELSGGPGGDHLVGGEGIAYYSGSNNNDTINSLDNRQDTVSCGLGLDDQVLADKDLDAVYGDCERVTER